MRRAEVTPLKVSDIDSNRMVVHIRQGKGGKDRDVPLSPKLLETLQGYWRWKKPRGYLFPGEAKQGSNGEHITSKAGYYACKGAARRAGIQKNVGPHKLSHHAVTELAEMGLSDQTIMSIAGHVSREVLDHYSHIRLAAKRRALESLETLVMEELPADGETVLERVN